jgi:hypothetical protein
MSNVRSEERIDETVCLFKFTGVFHQYIYYEFENNIFLIRTAWILTYQNKIKDTLTNNKNITIITNFDEKINKCNWIVKSKYTEWAVNKGTIFSFASNNYTTDLIEKKAIAIGVLALDDNYPIIEILLTIFGSILAIIVFIIIKIKLSSTSSNSNYRRTF